MSLSGLLALAGFLGGAALCAFGLRHLFPDVSRRLAVLLVALPAALWGPALATGGTTLWTSAVYSQRPWRGMPVPAGAPRSTLATDPVLQMLPFRALVRDRLSRFEAPLWAPELGSGQALLGNAQSAAFSPLETLARPWPPLRAATLVAAWQTVVAGLLAAALARSLGVGGAGAAFAGIGWALSLGVVVWAHYPLGAAYAWMPGVLAGVVRLRGRRPRAEAALVVCATALTLSGHPETTAHTAGAAAALGVASLVALPRAARAPFARALLRAGLLVFCLCAPATLPVLAELEESARSRKLALAPDTSVTVPFEAAMLSPLASPFVHGNPRFGGWRGPWNFFEVGTIYPGFLPLALALAGAVALRGRGRALGGAAALALLVALDLPPLGRLLDPVPLLGHSAVGRLRLFWVLGIVLAAAWSVERLASTGRARWTLLAVSAALAAIAVVLAAGSQAPSHCLRVQATVALGGGLLAGACALVPRLRRWLPAAAATALAVELCTVALLVTPVLPRQLDLEPPPGFRAAIERSLAERPSAAPRFAALGWDAHPSLAALWGLWDVRGNDPMRPWAPAAILSRQATGAERPQELSRLRRVDEALLDSWAVRFLLTPRRLEIGPGWRTLWEGGPSRLSERVVPAPLFFFATRASEATDREQAVLLAADLPRAADERSVAVESPRLLETAARGEVARARRIANGFAVELAPGSAGLLASTVSWGRAWQARVGNDPLRVERVDGAFVGVVVPEGARELELVYRPLGFTLGLVLCAGGAMAVIASGLARRRAAHALGTDRVPPPGDAQRSGE